MTRRLDRRIRALASAGDPSLVQDGLRGVEKECLRVTPAGFIAQTDHPQALGSALTNRYITTDYSEALIEFITPPERSSEATLQFLGDIHQFTYGSIGEELLWATSMPCWLRSEADIPIAGSRPERLVYMGGRYQNAPAEILGPLEQEARPRNPLPQISTIPVHETVVGTK